jgi:hypothetical protein
MKRSLIILSVILVVLTLLDHGMRLQWQLDCQQDDQVVCPTKLWWF